MLVTHNNAIQEDEAEAKLSVKKPEVVEEKTIKRPSPKDKEPKVRREYYNIENFISVTLFKSIKKY